MKELFRRITKTPLLFTLIILILSLSITCLPSPVNASDEASSAIDNADNALRRAFEAVLEAERAGANVSDLINKLNGAGELFAEAKNAYRIGNYSEAVSRAMECSILADEVVGEALNLKSSASANTRKASLQMLIFSCVGNTAFLVILFSIWLWFKRIYAEKLMRMKPEVASDVEA